MNHFNNEDFLFLLVHCPSLTQKEKWVLAVEKIPELSECTHPKTYNRVLTNDKRNSFRRYLDSHPLNRLKKNYIKQEVGALTLLSPDYPYLLKNSFEPPFVLFYKGNKDLLNLPLLGIVGARECSRYGRLVLNKTLPSLLEHQIGIVSGLAKGIDTLAHTITMNYKGQTIAVIGTGLAVAYPKENTELQNTIAKNYLLLSEYPLFTPPRKHHFPMRNRIISGLSNGVLVIEARERSGSLITARIALEEGRDVFAVPGPITSELSKGCNELIKLGAIPFTKGEDLLNEWKSNN